MKRGQKIKKLLLVLPLIVGTLVVVIFSLARFLGVTEKGEMKIITHSTLTETINVSELSAAQFTYNGIAEVYKDEKKEKIKCRIRYDAKVKAGIDMQEVKFEFDDVNMTIKPILPSIKITANPVDESELSFIPADTTIEMNEALIACKEDVQREALESSELFESAEKNLQSIIEALLYPVVTPQGYHIIWE